MFHDLFCGGTTTPLPYKQSSQVLHRLEILNSQAIQPKSVHGDFYMAKQNTIDHVPPLLGAALPAAAAVFGKTAALNSPHTSVYIRIYAEVLI